MIMTQRDKNFKGGIQKGTVATDTVAKKLDTQCKTLKESITVPGLNVQRKIRQDQIPGGIGACEPDGGAWFKDGKLVAVCEGKKQGEEGNAIERWFNNYTTVRAINPNACYVTFCAGEGASVYTLPDGRPNPAMYSNGMPMWKALNIVHYENGYNKFVPNGNSCYMSKEGFTTEFMNDVMLEVLEYCAEND